MSAESQQLTAVNVLFPCGNYFLPYVNGYRYIYRVELHERMAEICRLRNVSSAELSRRTDLTPGAISRIQSNNRSPSLDTVKRLAKALEVTLDYLVGEKGNEKPSHRILSSEALELFGRKRKISIELRREFEDLTGQPSAPITVQGWANHADNRRFVESTARLGRTVK